MLALRVPPPPPYQGTQQLLLLDPQLLLQPRHSILLSTSQSVFCANAGSIEKLDPDPPFAFYEILHIPRHANQSQVKHKVSSQVMIFITNVGQGGVLPAVEEAPPRCGRGESGGQGQLCCHQPGLFCFEVIISLQYFFVYNICCMYYTTICNTSNHI